MATLRHLTPDVIKYNTCLYEKGSSETIEIKTADSA